MKKYFIITILALVCLQMVQAQTENYLLYKEYDPDYWVVVTPGQNFDIEIDDNGIPDVRYEVFWGKNSRTGSYVLAFNGWLACSSFEITGPFQVGSGGGMTVIMQTCPD